MSPQRYIFRRQRRWYSSPLYIFSLIAMILSGLFITQGFRRGEMKPLYEPTPTPTRVARSYADEAETHFQAGNLDAAIKSYEQAISIDPENGRLYAEMARILTYSTESQTTETEKQNRFKTALEAAEKAAQLAPEDSLVFAIRAFTLDWYASFLKYIQGDVEQSDKFLIDADQSASKAITLDETNTLAQVYRAEIMIDQQRYTQAKDSLDRALQQEPNLWEAHRVNGIYLESQGYYIESLNEFQRASELAPNMTFLYIKQGQAWRNQGLQAYATPKKATEYYEKALVYFEIAAKQNEQLDIQDPIPYLGIGRTYAQMGEFFAASRNMNKAIQYNPYDPDVYAQLGMVYRQARNYEDAILALGCGVRGCSAAVTCQLRGCNEDVDQPIEIEGQALSGATVVYYFTYASLLAGMYLPGDATRSNYCVEATSLIREIRGSSFGNDPTITGILNESESICRTMTSARPTQAVTPTATGLPLESVNRPVPTRTPTPTPRP